MDRNEHPNWMGGPDDQPFRMEDVELSDNGYPLHALRGSPSTSPAEIAPPEPAPAVTLSRKEMALRIEHGGPAVYAHSVVSAGLGDVGDVNVVAQYLDNVTQKSVTDDPLQRMLLDLTVLAFHRVAALHVASSQGRTPEATLAFNSAAVKLQAELRQSMLTLRELQRVSMEAGVFIQ